MKRVNFTFDGIVAGTCENGDKLLVCDLLRQIDACEKALLACPGSVKNWEIYARNFRYVAVDPATSGADRTEIWPLRIEDIVEPENPYERWIAVLERII